MRICCVTGMHRSGTSLVSRIVNLLGVHLGDEDDLLQPAGDNPSGFWEHEVVKGVNDRVLATLGGNWHEPPPMPAGWQSSPRLDAARKAAAEVLRERFAGEPVVGWKDPRTSLTLPFWRTVAPIERTVLCVRAPEEVVASLSRRNGFEPEKSAGLWLRYTVTAWLDDPGRLVVDYADFFTDLEAAVERLRTHLALAPPDPGQLEAIRGFVDPGLHHHDPGAAVPGPRMELARVVYELLASGDRAVEPLFRALAGTWDAEGRARLVVAEQQELRDSAQRLEAALEGSGQQVERLTRRLRAEIERAEFAQARLARYTSDRDDAVRAQREAEREAQRAQREAEELRQRHAVQEQAAAAKAAELAKVGEELRVTRAALEDVERKRGELEVAYQRLKRRRSVRVALAASRPFRPLFRMVRRVRKRDGLTPAGTAGGRDEGGDDQGGDPATQLWHPQRLREDLDAVERLADVGPVTVVVPVYNAAAEVRRCLDALVRNTSRPARLLLIDDASTEPEIAQLLDEAAGLEGVTVLRNPTNLGFVRTVNRGFEACDTDVVVLNSDTEVTPRWLENLAFAAYRADDIGTVTPLSNNAGAFSVPDIGVANGFPEHLPYDDVGRLVTQFSQRRYPATPTGNGFCLYVKRALLDQVGGFDAEAFPRGYGEENDLCMRAAESGWRHVIDDATFVFHARSASFKAERAELVRAGRQAVDARHPQYTSLVRAFVRSPELAAVQERVRAAYDAAGQERVRPRVLFVIHDGHGGTPQTNLDLMRGLEDRYDGFLLTCDTRKLRLHQLVEGETRQVEEVVLPSPVAFGETMRRDYRRLVAAVLLRFGIELVHVRHLFKHTLDLPEIAGALGIPVVLSLHDYYFVCPTIHLLDDRDRFCGGACTPGQGTCRVPTRWVRSAQLPLKHDWVYVWRERVGAMLEHCDALVTTSPGARDIYQRAFPQLAGKPFEIIEHGRDLAQGPSLARPPEPGGPVRILVPGNLDVHKGARFIADLRALDLQRKARLEFHFMGDAAPGYEQVGVWHGRYQRDEFDQRVKAIEPAFVGLFSIWAETYSHTLTEAWAAGVPVLASELGALGERVRAKGGGWTIDVTDLERTYETILALADDPDEYERVRAEATIDGIRSVADMADDYAHLYKRVRRRRRGVTSTRAMSKHSPTVPRIGLVVTGSPGAHPGSVYVRTLCRFEHPAVASRVQAKVVDVRAFLAGQLDVDVLYVQRTAVPPGLIDQTVDLCRARGVPIVVDIDDNLLDEHVLPRGGRDQWERFASSLRTLLRAAQLVTVSTDRLAVVARTYAEHVRVVPNQLDEQLWFRPAEQSDDRAPRDDTARPLRLLYMGTKTHGEDLALLRPVLPLLREKLGQDVELEVIGGEPEGEDQDWYRRLYVPAGNAVYPAFVRWLRSHGARWDIAVAPLEDTPFNRYKSDLKYLEYSALGLPGVYSSLPPYRETVQPGVTGELADGSPEAWIDALAGLADPDRRKAVAEGAREQVARSRTMRANAESYLDVIFSALS